MFRVLSLLLICLTTVAYADEKVVGDWENEVCPVMGQKVDPKLFFVYEGKKVHICCGCCEAKFKKDPEKYLKLLEEEKLEKEALDW